MSYKDKIFRVFSFCHDCNWENDDLNLAQKLGCKHAKKYGHEVECELTLQYIYGKKV